CADDSLCIVTKHLQQRIWTNKKFAKGSYSRGSRGLISIAFPDQMDGARITKSRSGCSGAAFRFPFLWMFYQFVKRVA
ncbi:hypothetical protein AB9F46_26305, partial [Rhizobium leguminosarum]|uniref:hypothetical protein n=1 Tax=Rhizobium leguminosarum TaxID=384 RepID=UPI003F94E33A